MIQHRIASVVNFCTNDARFLHYCIEEVKKFSEQIIIPVCDHFFDGTPENYALLERIYNQYPACQFIEFEFNPNQLYGTYISLDPSHPDWRHHWHNSGRLIAYYFLEQEINTVFFMDGDEVPDGDRMTRWLNENDYQAYEAVRLASYCYFREARYCATTWPDAGLLVKKEVLTPERLLDCDERMGLFLGLKGKKVRLALGLDQKPLIHHFSWVRPKKEMLRKVEAWGHHWERNWPALIEEEFSRPFNGKDFVRHYDYVEVDPPFDPLKYQMPKLKAVSLERHLKKTVNLPNVMRVNALDIFRKELTLGFNL